ncbi:MAG: hypothetical protein M5U05_15660 [Anaerolineales bacterium]|nr:hypothetical protein [Anaerolineales bacterium]
MNSILLSMVVPVLLIGIIGLVVGVVVGAILDNALKGSRPPVSDEDGQKLPAAMQVWHDPRSHKLIIEYDGSIHQSASKLTADQKTKLAELVDDLRLWLGLGMPIAPSDRLQQVGDLSLAKAAASGEQVYAGLAEQALISQAAGAPSVQAKSGKEVPKTIAEQIDEILQEKLPQTEMRNRGIRLMELPGRGMVVMVDGKSYEGVSDVPDDAVRELIQSCVAEWENRG